MSKRNVIKLYGNIQKDLKDNPENYNTGLVGESLIIASYKQMSVENLKKLRYIIDMIIKKKIEIFRQNVDAGNVQKEINKQITK